LNQHFRKGYLKIRKNFSLDKKALKYFTIQRVLRPINVFSEVLLKNKNKNPRYGRIIEGSIKRLNGVMPRDRKKYTSQGKRKEP
jgi:hypothetical protein